ncbi:class IIb bacteriocin, lactobin A/cerein 7B family [Leuconostoc rapi]|uniref:class IIb bacteriocin, lactobin A/cerein 7B family n=1 Tax=Leuconostoc rapi TaxID=1406906 RepID=UPI00195D6248|nr:class IIb bacteriocin, lactobin A/cerein 7B family [Leuconostoc rapi]MBM7436171.1 lactobin A/cerein 7B family class IIb bacteriocin [Leuconostoc rapi]
MNMDLNILTDKELENINGGSSDGIWVLVGQGAGYFTAGAEGAARLRMRHRAYFGTIK